MKIKLTMMALGRSSISCTGLFDSRIENTPSMGSEKLEIVIHALVNYYQKAEMEVLAGLDAVSRI